MGETGPDAESDNAVVGSFFRNPFGLFATILVVGFALIGVGMTAFGGGTPVQPPKTLTLAQYRRSVRRLGQSMCLQIKPTVNKGIHSLRQLRTGIGRLTVAVDRFRTGFYALVPPRSRSRSYFRLRSHIDGVTHAMRNANHLAATGQWGRLAWFVRSKAFRHPFRYFGPLKDDHHHLSCRTGHSHSA